ncbi:MAG: transcription elongation factor GreA [bacterium]|nr:transcription elongation factor GreA [bacterium]
MPQFYLTKERLVELQEEVKNLKTEGRKATADRLKKAKDYGDLSENSEYSEAKEEQDRLERRIFELEEMLKNVSIIEKPVDKTEVTVGATIKVMKGDKETLYNIVGSNETKPEEGKISNESPLGMAFLGKKVGDTVKIGTPGGEVLYKIVSIE